MQSTSKIRVLLVTNIEQMRDEICTILSRDPDFEVMSIKVKNGIAVDQLIDLEPNVVIIELGAPNDRHLEIIDRLANNTQAIRSVVVSSRSESAYALQVLNAGGYGYVLNHRCFEDLIGAVNDAANRRTFISPGIGGIASEALPLDTRLSQKSATGTS